MSKTARDLNQVEATALAALQCRSSLVALGYLKDNNSAIAAFSSLAMRHGKNLRQYQQQQTPLLNRAAWVRAVAMNELVRRFLLHHRGAPRRCQLVALGAGLSVDLLHLPASEDRCVVLELDTPAVCRLKRDVLLQIPELQRLVDRPGNRSVASASSLKPAAAAAAGGSRAVFPAEKSQSPPSPPRSSGDSYFLLPVDLRDIKQLDAAARQASLDAEAPTLFVAEMVLPYLEPAEGAAVLAWAHSRFRNSTVLLYEPVLDSPATITASAGVEVNPDPAKADVAAVTSTKSGAAAVAAAAAGTGLTNAGANFCGYAAALRASFEDRGCPIHTPAGGMTGRAKQLVEAGWAHAAVVDAGTAARRWAPAAERRRVARLEPFDEFAALAALLKHYCVAVGVSDRATRTALMQANFLPPPPLAPVPQSLPSSSISPESAAPPQPGPRAAGGHESYLRLAARLESLHARADWLLARLSPPLVATAVIPAAAASPAASAIVGAMPVARGSNGGGGTGTAFAVRPFAAGDADAVRSLFAATMQEMAHNAVAKYARRALQMDMADIGAAYGDGLFWVATGDRHAYSGGGGNGGGDDGGDAVIGCVGLQLHVDGAAGGKGKNSGGGAGAALPPAARAAAAAAAAASSARAVPTAELKRLAVALGFRGRGVGTALLAAAEAAAMQRRCDAMVLSAIERAGPAASSSKRSLAGGFYDRHGFARTDESSIAADLRVVKYEKRLLPHT